MGRPFKSWRHSAIQDSAEPQKQYRRVQIHRRATAPCVRVHRCRHPWPKLHGPKFRYHPEGKFVSSLNALTTGRYAKDGIPLSLEDSDAFEAQVAEYARLLQPRSRVEQRLCRELAGLDWRIARYQAVEARLVEREIEALLAAEASTGRSSSTLDVITQAHVAAFDLSPAPPPAPNPALRPPLETLLLDPDLPRAA